MTASEENVYFGGRLVGKWILSQSGIGNGLVSDFTADRVQSKGNGSIDHSYRFLRRADFHSGGKQDRESWCRYPARAEGKSASSEGTSRNTNHGRTAAAATLAMFWTRSSRSDVNVTR